MSTLAVIGGTGMNRWPGLRIVRQAPATTPYGAPAAPLAHGEIGGLDVIFLPRHGEGHKLPPHLINYRANLWALKDAGVRRVVAIAAVGGIARNCPPAAVAVPHDVVDYTWGREHTYADGVHRPLDHVEFGEPYAAPVRAALLKGARQARVKILARGVMGVTQGPRLESPAEIRRMRRDGCTLVGMTGMPEAALAAELGIEYACLAVCVNWAAGIGTGKIHGEIAKFIETGMARVRAVLGRALPLLA
ncbi:MAG TPA: S-methyl-5'-thioinosine phosphorylase [Candidatus Binatia bacterium]|nr:S-methyl-5'-thioinosine phosphorylase [Candidatus Binatia bacterium]